MISTTVILAFVFLLSASALSALETALQRLGRLQAEEELKKEKSPFFFRRALYFFFGRQIWEGLLFSLSFTKHLVRIAFVSTAFFVVFSRTVDTDTSSLGRFDLILTIKIAAILAISLIFDFLFSLAGHLKARITFRFLSPLTSFILFLCIPITAPFFRILKLFLPKYGREKKTTAQFKIRDKVFELLQETELGAYLDSNEQKLILSVVSFKERIAREVMVPRINLFSLSHDTSLREAAQNFLKEGYSRIPVYKENVDNIIGVLLYKDILKIYIETEKKTQVLDQTIDKFVKPVFYTPETKKISQLLQEFRSKQIHLAIIVDEWGGTEGIVTIEDILEELVGEIADEYDIDQQTLFTTLPAGGWIVDAKMSIIDIQEELGVNIPQSPEYDTIGGYIFHRAGAIPSKGWRIHHDDFDLEILSSSERAIEKIKIIPHE
ncbi:MAG TPA: hemolysin family protein [Rhabdochlamydiaceae bacterium]|jgi:CBS domain containing-hemolysin-like protein